MWDDKRKVFGIVGAILLVGAVASFLSRGTPVNERAARVQEYVSRPLTRHVARPVRSDARNPAAAVIHDRYRLKFEWLKEPAYNAATGWNNAMGFWFSEIQGDGQIYLPQWEALVYGYGQWIAYQRQGDSFVYEEMNQEMHSVMYATRTFLESRALKLAKIVDRKTRMDSKKTADEVKRRVQLMGKQISMKVKQNAINLPAAQNHVNLANQYAQQRDHHQREAQKLLNNFYNELTRARQSGMSHAQWSAIVNFRAQYVGQRNAETNYHYHYLVQFSHYVLYKYRYTW